MLKTTNKMEKFKVKVDEAWLIELSKDDGVFLGTEENAKVFDLDDAETIRLELELYRRGTPDTVEFIPVLTEKQPESKPKELDLCEILKDAPMGLKLWSVVYGWVEFDSVELGSDYQIKISDGGNVTREGYHLRGYIDAECTLWPSKDNRDWSTFKLPYKLPVKGELCWTMSSVGNWVLRFATGEIDINNRVMFFNDQNCKSLASPYNWQPLSEVPEVLKNHLKLK